MNMEELLGKKRTQGEEKRINQEEIKTMIDAPAVLMEKRNEGST